METTALKYKKGLSVLKAKAAKDIKQRHLFLLYQSVVPSVIDYGLALNNGTEKSAKSGQSAERGNAFFFFFFFFLSNIISWLLVLLDSSDYPTSDLRASLSHYTSCYYSRTWLPKNRMLPGSWTVFLSLVSLNVHGQ